MHVLQPESGAEPGKHQVAAHALDQIGLSDVGRIHARKNPRGPGPLLVWLQSILGILEGNTDLSAVAIVLRVWVFHLHDDSDLLDASVDSSVHNDVNELPDGDSGLDFPR